MSLAIRPLQPGEALALRAVFHSSVHTLARRHYTVQQCEAWAPADFDMQAWVARIEANRPWVATWDGHAIGFSDLQPGGHIDQFFVAGGHGGRGIGSALLSHLLQQARTHGLARLTSDVSLTAQPLFTRHGFVVEKRQTVVLRGETFENARMALDTAAG